VQESVQEVEPAAEQVAAMVVVQQEAALGAEQEAVLGAAPEWALGSVLL